jgi:hypothetical protein
MTKDVVIQFGPAGKYFLYLPIKDIEATAITGQSFVEAGRALSLYAQEKENKDTKQKVFDWDENWEEINV